MGQCLLYFLMAGRNSWIFKLGSVIFFMEADYDAFCWICDQYSNSGIKFCIFYGALAHFWALTTMLLAYWDRWIFYKVRMSSPCSVPNLQGHSIFLCLAPRSKPVLHRWPYQQLGCCLHNFQVHWCIPTPFDEMEVLLKEDYIIA